LAEVPRYTLDASVAVKWRLRDEEQAERAAAVLADFSESRIDLAAPSHLRLEVASSILKAYRRRRITFDAAARSMAEVSEWGITLIDASAVETFRLSTALGCSFYDAAYLQVAESTGQPLLSADAKLRAAVGTRFPHFLWLLDYRSPS